MLKWIMDMYIVQMNNNNESAILLNSTTEINSKKGTRFYLFFWFKIKATEN